MSASRTTVKLRKQLLAKPGFTRLPVCPTCLKEIALLDYARHTRECKRSSPQPPAAAGTNGTQSTPTTGLVYGLFTETAVARLEKAAAEIARLRQQLRDEHNITSPEERVARCREIARRECQSIAVVVYQLRQRFANQGSGMVFLRNLRPSVVGDSLRDAQTELNRMSDPEAWRLA